jgi:phospholipid transport system substrate-binding protein
MKFHFGLPLVLILGTVGLAQAQPPYAYPPGVYGPAPRVTRGEQAADVLREGIDKLLAFLGKEETPNKLQIAAFLDKEIAPYFDFGYMARWVAGPRWWGMTEERRKALAADVESRFLTVLTGQLAQYGGQQVRYFRPRMSRRGAVDVRVGILHPGSYPSKLDFRMYHSDEGWKVYDVVANGRSAAAYYRVQFNHAASAAPGMPYMR